MKQTITAVIPALNEERNIARCLGSLDFCDRVVVLWMGSDQTDVIAKKMGAEVVKKNTTNRDDFKAVQKNINWAIDNCKTDWMLRIDADEEVSPELRKEIVSLLHGPVAIHNQNNETMKELSNNAVAYGIPRKPFFLGTFLNGGDWAYDRLVRLFKPSFARYDPIVEVHEQFKVDGKVGYLKNYLLHYSHPDLKTLLRKFNSYTDVQIKEIKDNLFVAFIKMLILPPYIFLRWMIWHLGIRDGWRGVMSGLLRSWYEFILYKKYILSRL